MAFTMSTAIGQNDAAADAAAIMKGKYIFQMVKNVDWPKKHKTGNFIIGIYGDENVYKYISSKYSGKLVGSQPVKVVRYISTNEISDCPLLYISGSKSNYIQSISKNINQNKTIIITNKSGLINQGPIINFVPIDGRIKWELNLTKAEKHNFIIGEMIKKYAYNII